MNLQKNTKKNYASRNGNFFFGINFWSCNNEMLIDGGTQNVQHIERKKKKSTKRSRINRYGTLPFGNSFVVTIIS